MKLHEKIQQLKLTAKPIRAGGSFVNDKGELVEPDLKVSADTESRTVKGYLTVFGVKDTFGTVPVKGCFAKSIQERGPDSNSKQKIAFAWQHDVTDLPGRFTVLKEDDYGLYFEATCDEVPTGERTLVQINSGTLNQFSYGFNYIWDKMEYDEQRDAVLMYEVALYEGSVVTFGSCDQTYAIRSIGELETRKEQLDYETEDLIKSLPRNKQLEFRQLIASHISLSQIKPDELRQNPLEAHKPDEQIAEIGGYKLNVNQFKS